MSWSTVDFGDSHEGYIGVLLADGTEPPPQYVDVGSSSYVPSTREWWAYDGTLGRRLADRYRAACACGWRGTDHPLNWTEAKGDRADYQPPGAYEEWQTHIGDVAARTATLPEDVTASLGQLRSLLADLADEQPLVAMRALAVLDDIVQDTGHRAAVPLHDGQAWDQLGAALGISPDLARRTVSRYL